jgi:putative inorganic carbon (HCO3(-)) transporter
MYQGWRYRSFEEHPLFIRTINLLKSPVGYAIVLLISFGLTFIITKLGLKVGLLFVAAPLALILILASFFDAKAGILIIFMFSFFIFHLKRMVFDAIPFGAVVEAFTFVTVLGILFTKYKHRKDSWAALNHPFTYFIAALFLYFIIQAFNPNMHSIGGWLFGIRKAIANTLIYFIMIFAFDEKRFFKNFINIWLVLSFVTGAYGCFQEWFGFTSFERAFIFSSEHRLGLIFVDGHFRKFSFLSDPTVFGVLMALAGTFCLIQMIGPTSTKKKLLYLFFAVFIFLGMGYSGTRTAFVVVPASMLLFIFMTINNRNTLIAAVVFGAGMLFVIFGPIEDNPTVDRIRSTFEFSDDASLNVRDENRAMIQPYIYDHIIGGGVMTSGSAGDTYNPNHPLAGFPPDSAYLRMAIESGVIGLIFICLFYFTILRVAIVGFYRANDTRVKYYYLGFAALFYGIAIAEYAQEVAGQMPCSFIFLWFVGHYGKARQSRSLNFL